MNETRKCLLCDKPFEANRKTAKFCSKYCRLKAPKSLRERQASTGSIQKRRHGPFNCEFCNIEFMSPSLRQTTYCSRFCFFLHKQERTKLARWVEERAIHRRSEERKALKAQQPEAISRYVKRKLERKAAGCKRCGEPKADVRGVRLSSYCDTCRVDIAKARKALRAVLTIDDTTTTLNAIFERDCGVCFYCKRQCNRLDLNATNGATRDHIIPLTRDGKHIATNLVLACRSCNAKKHNRMPSIVTDGVIF